MNRLTLTILASLTGGSAALAGDAASLNVLGFDSEGKVFALEEYGIQDGSGFPYANRFYIDTISDDFMPGTPIRVRIDDEQATVADARSQAERRGETIVPGAVLAAHPGYLAGFNPVTEVSADASHIVVMPRAVFPPIDEPLEFRIEEITLKAPSGCESFGPIKGFRLLRIEKEPEPATLVLHEDRSVPQSRRCPTGYSIGGVQTFYPEHGGPVYAVLIAVRSQGFEGPDHRWMAVTGRF